MAYGVNRAFTVCRACGHPQMAHALGACHCGCRGQAGTTRQRPPDPYSASTSERTRRVIQKNKTSSSIAERIRRLIEKDKARPPAVTRARQEHQARVPGEAEAKQGPRHQRANEFWSAEEERTLSQEFNRAIGEIARNHERSPRAILMRLDKLGLLGKRRL